jgi:hypothetical protein
MTYPNQATSHHGTIIYSDRTETKTNLTNTYSKQEKDVHQLQFTGNILQFPFRDFGKFWKIQNRIIDDQSHRATFPSAAISRIRVNSEGIRYTGIMRKIRLPLFSSTLFGVDGVD